MIIIISHILRFKITHQQSFKLKIRQRETKLFKTAIEGKFQAKLVSSAMRLFRRARGRTRQVHIARRMRETSRNTIGGGGHPRSRYGRGTS